MPFVTPVDPKDTLAFLDKKANALYELRESLKSTCDALATYICIDIDADREGVRRYVSDQPQFVDGPSVECLATISEHVHSLED
jgi:hypothetical protein